MTAETQNSVPVARPFSTLSRATGNDRCDRIYMEFFNLKGAPFSITPDPEFLFLSETHRSVIEKIEYSIRTRMGFMLLTGEVGTGKTTLCRALLDHLQNSVQSVYVINPSISGNELLSGILDDLGISYPPQGSKKELIDRLNQFLLANETTSSVVIIVDDAQTMPLATLEDLRLLSNLETDKAKLLQILLVGQPELLYLLAHPQIRQLKQRVAVNCFLNYLTCDEVGGYIECRLFIAGNQGQIRFTPRTVKQIYKQSGGVPRMINKICDLALTAAYATNSNIVDSAQFKAACGELIELRGHRSCHLTMALLRLKTALAAGMALLIAMIIGFGTHAYLHNGLDPQDALGLPVAIWSSAAEPEPNQMDMPDKVTSGPALAFSSTNEIRAYILQLGSFNTLATTLRAVDIYSRKGIEAHWSGAGLGGKGLWYRVFVGRYPSIGAAREYQDRADLAEAQILYAPWAVVFGPAGTADGILPIQRRLQSLGMDSYTMPGQGGLLQLCSGAFVSQDRAEAMARQIHDQTGMAARVTSFHPALMSIKPNTSSTATGDPS
jgi:type II secretory pathway predicted ATPase ExeA/cell division septation protein DedD